MDDDSDEEAGDATGRMLAREWSTAANFRRPSAYDIPTAPTFDVERRDDGTAVLVSSADATRLLTADELRRVRR